MRKATLLAMVVVLAAAVVLVGCKKKTDTTAQSGKIGGSVSVLAVWGGSELDIFNNMIKPFEDRTGITVNYTGTRDVNAVLTTRLQAGNPPDTAGLPGPGQMAQYARDGKLVDLSKVLDVNRMKQQYAQSWMDLGTVDGKMVGIFLKASLKGLIWYVPSALKAEGITSLPSPGMSSWRTPRSWPMPARHPGPLLLRVALQAAGPGRTG
jgi:alpha-glucoside transport system substrate-binding protein